MAGIRQVSRQVSSQSLQSSNADAVMQWAGAESLRVVDYHADGKQETSDPAPATASGQRSEFLVKGMALLVCLGAYTFGPIFVNWSVGVNVPPEAEATILTLAARNVARNWYGVTLAHQPGIAKLYVEAVSKGGSADTAGVYPGDRVSRGEQEGRTVFDESSFNNEEALLEVKAFVERAPPRSYPKANPPLIDPTKPLTLTIDMGHVDVHKGKAYLGVGIVFMRNFCGSIVVLVGYLAWFKGSISKLYTLGNISILILPGLGWTTVDLFELLANSNTNAAVYSVLSQTRLMATALLIRVMFGAKQSTPQIACLVSLTFMIFCYMQAPDSVPAGKFWNGYGKPYDPNEQHAEAEDLTGIIFSFAKVALSIIMGVVGQKALQKEEFKSLPMVGLQALIYSASTLATLPFMLLYMWSTGWDKGVFGGYPVEFRHCLKSWDQETCNLQTPVVVEQGWDYRAVIVVTFYIFRSLILNVFLRMFDALTGNFVNAAATVLTYILSLLLLGKEFNFTKFGLTVCIVLQIVQYAFAPQA